MGETAGYHPDGKKIETIEHYKGEYVSLGLRNNRGTQDGFLEEITPDGFVILNPSLMPVFDDDGKLSKELLRTKKGIAVRASEIVTITPTTEEQCMRYRKGLNRLVEKSNGP